MASLGEPLQLGELLRYFAGVADSTAAIEGLIGDEHVIIEGTERDVLASLVHNARSKLDRILDHLGVREDAAQPDSVAPQLNGAVATVDASDTALPAVIPEVLDASANGREPSVLTVTSTFDRAAASTVGKEVASEVEPEYMTDEPGSAIGAIVLAEPEPVVGPELDGGVEDGDAVEPVLDDDAKDSGVELLPTRETTRHEAFVPLSAAALSAHEQRMAPLRTEVSEPLQLIIRDFLTADVAGREIRLRLPRDGSPSMILTVVNTLLEQLVINGRTEITSKEIAELTGFKGTSLNANYGHWVTSRLGLAPGDEPFITTYKKPLITYRVNPKYVFSDLRSQQGAEGDSGTDVELEQQDEGAGAEEPGTEGAVGSTDVDPPAFEPPAEAVPEAIVPGQPVRLTSWGLEWGIKGGNALVQLDGRALIGMKPLMADMLALIAQNGGSIVFPDLFDKLESKHADLQPTELLTHLTHIGDLFRRANVGQHYTNEIHNGDGGPQRIITLGGVLPLPKDYDFLAQQILTV